jgi:gluconate 2-dehydrogenase gamma chain
MTDAAVERTRGISRSGFLRKAGAAGVATALPVGLLGREGEAADLAAERETLETFSLAESETVDAFCARLIPTDALGPGAREARVARYIDRALAGALRANAAAYTANIAALDRFAVSTYGSAFVQLTDAQQDAILTRMVNNTAPGFSPDARTFFNLIREHTLQGMFGDPYHGGNANGVGWRLMGFPGISLDVKSQDQRLNISGRTSSYRASTYDFALFKPAAVRSRRPSTGTEARHGE